MPRSAGYVLLALLVAAAPAASGPLTATTDDCGNIVAHAPSADIAYQPGVDVQGNAVAPADLDGSGGLDLDADDIIVSIEIPLIAIAGVVGDEAAFVANGGQIDTFGATASVGTVTLRGGDVYFDGKPISDREREAVAAACAEVQRRRPSEAAARGP